MEETNSQKKEILFASAIFFGITAVSFLLRWTYFASTIGFQHGTGTEEYGRLEMVFRPFPTYFTQSFGPFQTIISKLFQGVFPAEPFITRWVSLGAGTLGPGLIFLALRKYGNLIAIFAALSLAASYQHIYFSTLGIAEALAFSLSILLIIAFNQAQCRYENANCFRAGFWAALGVLCLNAAMLTRYETWIFAPIIGILALIRQRKLTAIWLLMIIAPIAWLWFCKVTFGNAFSSIDLIQPASKHESIQNTFHALTFIFTNAGLGVLVLMVFGAFHLYKKDPFHPLPSFAIGLSLFILFMTIKGKIIFDEKYNYNMIMWLDVLAGVGAATVGLLCINQIKDRFMPKLSGLKAKRLSIVLSMVILVFIMSFKVDILDDYKKGYLDVTKFEKELAFTKALAQIDEEYNPDHKRVLVLVHKFVPGALPIYAPPPLKKKLLFPPGHLVTTAKSTIQNLLLNPQEIEDAKFKLIALQSGENQELLNDLEESEMISARKIHRIYDKDGFQVYMLSEEASEISP